MKVETWQYNDLGTIRAAAILTGSYVAATVISASAAAADSNTEAFVYDWLTLMVDFTKGSLTDASIKVEFSPDGTNYYQETSDSISSGVNTHSPETHLFAATGAYRLRIPIKDRYIKVSAIGNGTTTNSSMTIKATLGS